MPKKITLEDYIGTPIGWAPDKAGKTPDKKGPKKSKTLEEYLGPPPPAPSLLHEAATSPVTQSILDIGGGTAHGLESGVGAIMNLPQDIFGVGPHVTAPPAPFAQPEDLSYRIANALGQYAPAMAGAEATLPMEALGALRPVAAGVESGVAGTPGGPEQRLIGGAVGGATVPFGKMAMKGIGALPRIIKKGIKSTGFDKNNTLFLKSLLKNNTRSSLAPFVREGLKNAYNQVKGDSQALYKKGEELASKTPVYKSLLSHLGDFPKNNILIPRSPLEEGAIEKNGRYFMPLSLEESKNYRGVVIPTSSPNRFLAPWDSFAPKSLKIKDQYYQGVPVKNLTIDSMEKKGGISPIRSLEGLKELYSTIGDKDAKTLITKYLNDPTYTNAHALQSDLGNLGADLAHNPLNDAFKKRFGSKILNIRSLLKEDTTNALNKHSPQAAEAAKTASDHYLTHMAPYKSAPLRQLINPEKYGASQESLLKNLASDDPRVTMALTHLAHYSPDARRALLFSHIAPRRVALIDRKGNIGIPSNKKEALLNNYMSTLRNLEGTAGAPELTNNLSKIVSPNEQKQMNMLLTQYGAPSNLKDVLKHFTKKSLLYGLPAAAGVAGAYRLENYLRAIR